MNKTLTIITVAVIVLVVFGLGFYTGQTNGKKQGAVQAENKYKALIDIAFPPPPAEMTSLSGVVSGVYGATINVEITDPNDYLPHVDGTSQKKQVRYASITSATKIISINHAKLDAQGNPEIKTIRLSDIKIGDTITVRSDQNIKNAQKFDVSQVELIKS